MKLKLVVASMSILGLVSCPVLADTTPKHHKHHHKMMKRHVREVAKDDYKDMAVMKDEVVCTISQADMLMTAMTQNMGRAWPNPCMSADWYKRIQLSGGVNVDVGKFGNRNRTYQGENYQRLSLNDAYINLAADVNDWTKAFASISFSNPTTLPDDNGGLGEYSAAYANNIQGTANNVLQLEQAYAVVSNFDVSPIFLQFGKGFQDFGRYEIHPIERSMTQVMSETLATSLKVGFVLPMGLTGSAAVFDNPTPRVGKTTKATNWDVAIGYDQINDQLGFDLGAAWLYNMYGVNDTAYSVNNFTGNTGYNHRVSGIAVYADVNSGPFSLSGRYTTALQRFSMLDLPSNGTAVSTTGAKPWSADFQAGFGFNDMFGFGWGRKQNLYVGYQTSRETAGLNLPLHRWLVGYNIDAWRSTNFGIEWDHDIAHTAAHGGGQGSSNLVSLRAAVQFG